MKALKRLALALVVTLAINFLGLAVAGLMLAQSASVDREKLTQIRTILFPPPEPEAEVPVEAEPPEPTPMEELLAMLDAQSGKPADRRVEAMDHELDARALQLRRQERQLEDRLRQLARANAAFDRDRAEHEARVAAWDAATAAARERLRDEGFRAALEMYQQMPADQAKRLLLGLEDDVALAMLKAMDGRAAAKILKTFEEGEETERLRRLLEMMRRGEPDLPATPAAPTDDFQANAS